ncbi:type IV secretory system conjugative DNA transfer family protein [Parachitinimonas caeni]|uniref:Type IV secretory system conjugative DNA transfer family protein n=1 Tax=Parachitinimonas caeni TaxID=3031301 RepID=A0ABT7E306_9NEIS|nr:type IV secretory system conjugative DNA transfer family protein [Parachitinimonas caeni]MDK2126629.1 type IV secretory system conjugative DNA transfer family protein [Parachitinimonas caeni]
MDSKNSLATPLYTVPTQRNSPGTILMQNIGAGVFLGLILSWICTQYVASQLGYQEALGEPMLVIGSWKLYPPINWWVWYSHYHSLANPVVQSAFRLALWLTLFGGLAIAGFIAYRAQQDRKRQASESEHLHGSAHWASANEVKQTGLLGNGSGVYVGAWKDASTNTIHYLRHDGPEHIMAFAPTRSGKGVGLVLPTLLSWPHSALIYDIKGENWALTAGWRQQEAGNRVVKFEPSAMDGSSARYNPLAEVRVGTDREVADVQNIMTMIVDPDGKGLEDHWQKSSQALLVGVALHVLYADKNKTLNGVIAFLSDPTRTVAESMQFMLDTDHDLVGNGWPHPDGTPNYCHPVVAAAARDMLNKAPEEQSGVVSTAISFLTLYRDPIVARNTAASDFRVRDLMNDDKPVSLYLVVPPSDKDRLRPLIRLIINQIVRGLTEKMEFKDGRSIAGYKHRLLLLLDEFPSLGKLDVFEESLAFIAGYGMKAYLIIQDISQLWTAYGKDESIFSNCHVRVAYAPNKIETAELLSKMTGTATIVKQSHSYSGSVYGSQSNVSISTQETQRPLLTADEVMRLPAAKKDAKGNVSEPGDMLIFMAGQTPIYGKQILYFLDPSFSARAKVPAPEKSDVISQDTGLNHNNSNLLI